MVTPTNSKRTGFLMGGLALVLTSGLILSGYGSVIAGRHETPESTTTSPDVRIIGPGPGSRLGGFGSPNPISASSMAQTLVVADFNGDGIPDLAISAPSADVMAAGASRAGAGVVYVLFGRHSLPAQIDLATDADLTILGANAGDSLGFSIAAGDINGSGAADLIIGAPGANSPRQFATGAVFIIKGSSSLGGTLDLQVGPPSTVIYGPSTGARFGASLATGDAGGPTSAGKPIADILVGAPGAFSGGGAFLFFGKPSFAGSPMVIDMSTATADFTLRGTQDSEQLGTSVALADLNGDGVADLFAGAPAASRPVRNDGAVSIDSAQFTGAVFGVFGPFVSGGSAQTGADFSFYGNNTGDQAGASLASGDVTGDAVPDLVVGAPTASGLWIDNKAQAEYHLPTNAGTVYVLAGRVGLVPRRLDAMAGEQGTTLVQLRPALLGFSVGVGRYSVNGSRSAQDMLFGQPEDPGGAGIVLGGPSLLSASTRPRFFGGDPDIVFVAKNVPLGTHLNLGFAVTAGDFNGDGGGDLVVAAPFASPTVAGFTRAQAGEVEIWLGAPPPLQVTTVSLPPGTRGVPYDQHLAATGGIQPYSWILSGGALPPGLVLASSGQISGTPSQSGTYSFTATVSDSATSAAISSLTITIAEPVAVPHITDARYKPARGKLTVFGDTFDPSATLLIDAQPVTANVLDSGTILAKHLSLVSGLHHLNVLGGSGSLSQPFDLTVP
jgi:hypothetical protein